MFFSVGAGDSDEKSKTTGLRKEEKKRKPNVFTRFQNSYRTKKVGLCSVLLLHYISMFCSCCSIMGGGGGGHMFDDKFVYVNTIDSVCFAVSFLKVFILPGV